MKSPPQISKHHAILNYARPRDTGWLTAYPDEAHAGLLLRAFRENLFKTRAEMARMVGISKTQYDNWEQGGSPIPFNKLDALKVALALEPWELEWLNERADLLREPVNRLAGKDDPAWRDSKKQAGLYLRNLRVKAKLDQGMLAEKLKIEGFNRTKLSLLEVGQQPMWPEMIKAVSVALCLTEEEAARLQELSKNRNIKVDADTVQLGAAMPEKQFPALTAKISPSR